MNALATTTLSDDVAIIMLDNPPVNAMSRALRVALLEELDRAIADDAVRAMIILCAGRTFVAGADITEFDMVSQEPSFAELYQRIEQSPKPVIAAIHGTALGGGFELALACHYRIMTARAKVGLPEVHLGVLPAGGGTQRLPRIVGARTAMDMMTSGRHVGGTEALSLGLVDRVAPAVELGDAARAFAQEVIAGGCARPKVRDREDRILADRDETGIFGEFLAANARRFKGFPAPAAIVKAVRAAVTLPFDEGLAREMALFETLVATPESAAQRHLFFAERGAARVPGLSKDTPEIDIRTVGIIGAGTMGGGIAMNFLNVGIPVIVIEMTQEALDRGLTTIRRNYEATASKGRITADQVEQRMSLIRTALDMSTLADVDLVIEAVYEDIEVKTAIFERLAKIAKSGAVLASNTSFLDLNRIAAATGRPEWVVGLHFFSPANVMRLLEVVRGRATSHAVIAAAMKLAKRIGKVAVLSGVCDGFIANRLLAPRGAQAEAMMLEGVPIADIDRVLVEHGFAMGHFQMMDLIGLDVIGRNSIERSVMGDLVTAGRLGQKSGAGYYEYDDRRRASHSPTTDCLINDVAQAKGIARGKVVADASLLARLIYPVVNEGAKILEEGIALRASDIDIAAVLGYNWPLYRGGPLFWADQLGLERIVAEMRELEAVHGEFFRPSKLLTNLAAQGLSFSEYAV